MSLYDRLVPAEALRWPRKTTRTLRAREFDALVRHRCVPSGLGDRLKGEHHCPVCRATWHPFSKTGWGHETNGTEGTVAAVVVRYPNGDETTFTRGGY